MLSSAVASASDTSAGGRIASDGARSAVTEQLAAAHELQELGEALREQFCVGCVSRRHDRAVERLQLGHLIVGDPVLALERDPDDHDPASFSAPLGSCCGGGSGGELRLHLLEL